MIHIDNFINFRYLATENTEFNKNNNVCRNCTKKFEKSEGMFGLFIGENSRPV